MQHRPLGIDCRLHVAPPSNVARMTPEDVAVSVPAAQPTEALTNFTPVNWARPAGIDWRTQVTPPSLVGTIAAPTGQRAGPRCGSPPAQPVKAAATHNA